jgi:hypothetical protein
MNNGVRRSILATPAACATVAALGCAGAGLLGTRALRIASLPLAEVAVITFLAP